MKTLWLLLFLCASVLAQPAAQYRGFWVDTFNTLLNNHRDILAVIAGVKRANCNVLFVQVRRRGDSWYRNSLEPLADRTPIEEGFDPLADLIKEAHANGIEVHAFVIIGAIWNGNPTATSPRLPENPNHVFNQHGFNQTTGKLYEGRDNWLTRTLAPDDANITFNGHRLGNEFWLDLGHPDAADYTLRVLLHLVRNYDLDGLHLDRIRYPEISVSGQSSTAGVSIGYNETSVARFNRRYGLASGSLPAQNDARWNQWRREQVTNFVRRVYLNATALKPRLKISAALIAFGGGPTTEAAWQQAECYWRVFQDWRAWTEEGILDLAIPMNYKREHTASQIPLLDTWSEWTKNHAYDRMTLLGLGVYLNSIEGTLRQIRKAVAPSVQNNRSQGVVFFSYAVTNEAVTANPLSFPPNRDTPRRSLAEFASALTTGKSMDGATSYEDLTANPTAVFAQPVPVPTLPWKAAPLLGHVMGVIKTSTGEIVDAADVMIGRITRDFPQPGRLNLRTVTDGNGFYGGLDLAPGLYGVTVTLPNESPLMATRNFMVRAGEVTRFDVLLVRNASARAVTSVSSASFVGPTLAPESIVSGFGGAMSATTTVASSLPLPTQLANVRVRVKDSTGNERFAPLFFVSAEQINYLLPAGTAPGVATVTTFNGENVTNSGFANVERVAPGLFSANANGSGVAAAVALRLRADGSQRFEPVAMFDAMQNRFVARPIELGPEGEHVFLILFGTGARFSQASRLRIGGLESEVLFVGASPDFVGLDQINARLPRNLSERGVVDVVLSADGYAANVVQLNIR